MTKNEQDKLFELIDDYEQCRGDGCAISALNVRLEIIKLVDEFISEARKEGYEADSDIYD